ncbi:FHA domain-containing protein [Isosphaeraceae bacterium EP7]
MDYQLSVLKGRSASNVVKLAGGVTTVGRQEDCQLRINSSQVSRRHCELYESKGKLMVKDLGSSNGTLVNGQKVEKPVALKNGDTLTVGPIKFRIDQISELASRTPVKVASVRAAAPGDTAISEALIDDSIDDETFELDFGEEPTTIPGVDPPKTVTGSPPKKAPETDVDVIPLQKEAAIGEDAVADFLLDLKIDEDD